MTSTSRRLLHDNLPNQLSHTSATDEAKAAHRTQSRLPFRERVAALVAPHHLDAARVLDPAAEAVEGRPAAVIAESASSPAPQPKTSSAPVAVEQPQRRGSKPEKRQPTGRPSPGLSVDAEEVKPEALTRNPRSLRYWKNRARLACAALGTANHAADKQKLGRIVVPRAVYDLFADIFDDTRSLSGVLEWVRERCGAAVLLEVEAACLYRVPGAKQIDDWSCARARRKLGMLVLFLMSPWELPRTLVTGSTSDEPVIVTCGFPQTGLVKLLRSSQRQPYDVRTLQRDLREIDKCTKLVMRWRTPRVKAQSWECQGQSEGVVNRYCIRAGMIRDQWRRSKGAAQALIKATRLKFASWLVWTPPPRRGEQVPALEPTPG